MTDCYVASPVSIRRPDRLFIGGQWVEPSSGVRLSVVNPTTEQEIACVAGAVEADIDRAVAAARKAFDNGPWPFLSPVERGDILLRLHAALERRAAELAYCWSAQVGVPHARTKAYPGIFHFAYYGNLIKTHTVTEARTTSYGHNVQVVREPVGVTAAIVAWNAPMMLTAAKLGPALAMGCTVVVKPSPETPLEAFILAEAAEEIGLPPGVINIVPAERGPSERLVAHPGIDKVAFTGSSAAGKRIATLCGSQIKRYTLELGGKSPAIVLDDADLSQAIPTLVGACTTQTGQACTSLSRVLVSRKRHDEFLDAYASAFGATRVGDPFVESTEMGPLALERQRATFERYVKSGLDQGAKLATGGSRASGFNQGFFVEPTVFYGVDNTMTIAREEIFGPVASVIAYDDLDQAVAIANDSDFGLLGSVFTKDDELFHRLSRRLRCGTVGQNAWPYDPTLPTGGFKQSGVGREGGPEGLDNYSEIKAIYPASADGPAPMP